MEKCPEPRRGDTASDTGSSGRAGLRASVPAILATVPEPASAGGTSSLPILPAACLAVPNRTSDFPPRRARGSRATERDQGLLAILLGNRVEADRAGLQYLCEHYVSFATAERSVRKISPEGACHDSPARKRWVELVIDRSPVGAARILHGPSR